ncbi:MAG TPA: MFS transporter, partial [Rudaea sp.]
MATIAAGQGPNLSSGHARVIAASSIGTVFEWYDFYLYGSLTSIIAGKFFAGFNETTSLIFAWLA